MRRTRSLGVTSLAAAPWSASTISRRLTVYVDCPAMAHEETENILQERPRKTPLLGCILRDCGMLLYFIKGASNEFSVVGINKRRSTTSDTFVAEGLGNLGFYPEGVSISRTPWAHLRHGSPSSYKTNVKCCTMSSPAGMKRSGLRRKQSVGMQDGAVVGKWKLITQMKH